jgi:hypothetical protein
MLLLTNENDSTAAGSDASRQPSTKTRERRGRMLLLLLLLVLLRRPGLRPIHGLGRAVSRVSWLAAPLRLRMIRWPLV